MIALVASVVPWMTRPIALRPDAGAAEDFGDPFEHARLGSGGRGEHLQRREAARMFEGKVGEGAADIDGEARALHGASQAASVARDKPAGAAKLARGSGGCGE